MTDNMAQSRGKHVASTADAPADARTSTLGNDSVSPPSTPLPALSSAQAAPSASTESNAAKQEHTAPGGLATSVSRDDACKQEPTASSCVERENSRVQCKEEPAESGGAEPDLYRSAEAQGASLAPSSGAACDPQPSTVSLKREPGCEERADGTGHKGETDSMPDAKRLRPSSAQSNA